MSSTTSNNSNRRTRVQLIVASIVTILVAATLLYYFLHKQETNSLNTSMNDVLPPPTEDTSVGKCLQHPMAVTYLQKLYLSNDPEVKEKYTDQTIYINGTYVGTGLDRMGTAYMLLKSSDRFHAIKCFLRSKEDINIAKGSPVILKGYCRGQIWDLKIEECELLEQPEVSLRTK